MLGLASWYSNTDRGIGTHTANRETFSDKKNACAIWNLPFNSLVRVTNLANGKSIVVRVNDRGPSKDLVRQGRLIDLTKGAFSKIAALDEGLIEIEMVVLN
ncbi:MAG: septal ring lytic transglycosylase RlpA family protein [Candidatus Aureabacteria bacterium]|nr:septal ring lytic transglycosylase RlpA family protein [Candidatus Auribacterota bacterium]